MIKITDTAAAQIRQSFTGDDVEQLKLRVAAKHQNNGSFEYAMGLVNEVSDTDDIVLEVNGVPLVIGRDQQALLEGMVIDFVEVEPGQPNFIFMNPNDPNYVPPSGDGAEHAPVKH